MLLLASQLCRVLQRAQQHRKNGSLLSSRALPSSAGNGHEAKEKQHPCLPGNREDPFFSERPSVVLAEAQVLCGHLGIEDLTIVKWQLMY